MMNNTLQMEPDKDQASIFYTQKVRVYFGNEETDL